MPLSQNQPLAKICPERGFFVGDKRAILLTGVKSISKNINKGAFLFGGILTLLHPDKSVPFFMEY